MHTRREFGKFALSTLAVSAATTPTFAATPTNEIDSTTNGVTLGVITYSFRALPHTPGVDYIDTTVKACAECKVSQVEVMSRLTVQPPNLNTRDEVRNWRLTTPMSGYRAVRDKFEAAGMHVFSYTNTFTEDFSDEELDKTFQGGQAMGVGTMGFTMMTVSSAPRLIPFAEKYNMKVAFHNKPDPNDPNQVASPESFEKLIAMSKNFCINLDIGHFTAANFDAVSTLNQLHERISHVHLKDRKRNGGANMPWGQGETPVKEILTTMRDRHYPMFAIVEYEYDGKGTPVEEVKLCLDYARRALA